jgi:hypothetical protein
VCGGSSPGACKPGSQCSVSATASLWDLGFAVFSIALPEQLALDRLRAREDALDDLQWVRLRGTSEQVRRSFAGSVPADKRPPH